MKPIKFKECNIDFAENQEEYNTLPALINDEGTVIVCWKLNFWDRMRVLFKGHVWGSLLMFGKPLTPTLFSTQKKDHITTDK